MMKRLIAATALGLALSGPAAGQPGPEAGTEVDPEAYSGLWYEIARTPTPFQQQCDGGVTAVYEQAGSETLRVQNRCDLPDGGVSSVVGTAQPTDGDFGRHEVAFEDAPDEGTNYVVEALGPEEDGRYAWAAVTAGEGRFGWILARSPDLGEQARQEAEAALESAGIDTAQLQATEQPPSNYDPEQE